MERFGVSDVDELDGFCRPTKKEQEAIRRLVGFRYSQKDRFLLISGLYFGFWGISYIWQDCVSIQILSNGCCWSRQLLLQS